MKKVLLIISAAAVVIVIAFAAFIKFYITPQRVKDFVIPFAEKALNRKVEIKDISINIFKGIGLKEFAVKEADSGTDFVRCREFVLKFKLLPLLHKQVVVDELKIISPEIRIYRDKDGRYNFDDIGKKKTPEEAGAGTETAGAEGLPISLVVSKVMISGAGVSFTDLKKELPDIKSSADIDLGIESIDGENLSTQGSIDLKLDEVLLRKPSEKSVRDITASLKYAVHVNLGSYDITIDRADLNIQKIPVSLSGTIKNLKTSPDLALALSMPDADTAELQKLAAPFADMKGLKLSGRLSADLKVRGAPKKPGDLRTGGSIMLKNIGVLYEGVSALLNGSIKFSEKLMNIDINTTVGKNTAGIKGTINNFLADQDIRLDIYSKRLLIDELIPAKAETTPDKPSPAGRKPVPEKPAKEAGPLDLKFAASGEIKVDSAIFRGMDMTSFRMKYIFRNNKLNIPEMTANAGKGRFVLSSLIDLSKPGYSYNLSSSLDSLHADEIVNSMFPKAKDTVYGLLSFNLKLNGAGTLAESIKKNLSADMDFNIKDGKITNAKVAENLSRFLNIRELETINLRKADGRVKIRDRVARLESVFTSDDISMDPKGDIGLDETLALEFDLKLSPRLTDKAMMNSGIAKFIKNDDGWGMIPLKVSGTFAAPSYTVDVAKAGKRIIKKETDKLLEKLFNKKEQGQQGDQQGPSKQQDPVKQLEKPLKELFKGMF